MPRSSSKSNKNRGFAGSLIRFVRRPYTLTVVAFVALFVVAGAYVMQQRSLAANIQLPDCPKRNIFNGSVGSCVAAVQYLLNGKHALDAYQKQPWLSGHLSVDGIDGPNTTAQVKIFQLRYPGMSNFGTVGPATWVQLCKEGTNFYAPDTVNMTEDQRVNFYLANSEADQIWGKIPGTPFPHCRNEG